MSQSAFSCLVRTCTPLHSQHPCLIPLKYSSSCCTIEPSCCTSGPARSQCGLWRPKQHSRQIVRHHNTKHSPHRDHSSTAAGTFKASPESSSYVPVSYDPVSCPQAEHCALMFASIRDSHAICRSLIECHQSGMTHHEAGVKLLSSGTLMAHHAEGVSPASIWQAPHHMWGCQGPKAYTRHYG